MSKILIYIWSTLWGKIIIIAVATLIAAVWWFVRSAAARVRREILALQRHSPEFSLNAIECRARSAAEAYFHGWNSGDPTALEPHLTQQALDAIKRTFADGSRKPFTINQASKPKLAQLITPDGTRPASVLVEFEISFPHIASQYGLGRGTFILELVYQDDGRWLVTSIKRDDAFLNFSDTENDFDTSWLEANTHPSPTFRTLSPQRPAIMSQPMRGTRRAIVIRSIFVVFLLLWLFVASAITWHMGSRRQLELDVLRSGETTQATVTTLAPEKENDGDYLVNYEFKVRPTDQRSWNFEGFMGDSSAIIPNEAAVEAQKTKRIEVKYLKEDPSKNLPSSSQAFGAVQFWLIAFALVGIPIIALFVQFYRIIQFSRRTYSPFWIGWKPSVRELQGGL